MFTQSALLLSHVPSLVFIEHLLIWALWVAAHSRVRKKAHIPWAGILTPIHGANDRRGLHGIYETDSGD